MIVEDEVMVAWAMETLVEEMGHKVVGLHSGGAAAIAAFAQDLPDLLLMDINLGSDLDGIETARRIRAVSAVPILFISAYGDAATRHRIAEAVPGAALLSKPVQPHALKRAIDEAVATPH